MKTKKPTRTRNRNLNKDQLKRLFIKKFGLNKEWAKKNLIVV